MKIVYALLYDVAGTDRFEISGIYSSLDSAKNAISNSGWHENGTGLWETWGPENKLWCIEAHALQD